MLNAFEAACVHAGAMPFALEQIARLASSEGAVLLHSANGVFLHGASSPGVKDYVESYFHEDRPKDIRHARVCPTLGEGFRVDRDDFDPGEIARDPFYQEFLRPRGLGWHACALLASTPSGVEVHLSVKRGHDRGAFTQDELAALSAQLPALRTATAFSLTLPAPLTFGHGQSGAPRRFLIGFDGKGAAFALDPSFSGQAVVTIRGGTLFCADPSDRRRLEHMVSTALRDRRGAACLLRDGEGRRWVLRVRPWGTDRSDFTTVAYMGALSPLDDLIEPTEEWIDTVRALFDLSHAEVRVAAMVAQGVPVETIARLHALSTGTVRNHLKSIFAKTEVTRQVELSVLLSRL